MTIEEKARAYDEALEKVKPLYEQAKKDDSPIWSTYEYLFPHLAEIDDERIRKWIKKEIEYKYVVEGIINSKQADEALGWLEKHKKCLADNSKTSASEDERIRTALCDIVRDMPYMETELRAHGLTVEKTLSYLENLKEEEGYEAIPVKSTLEYKLGFKDGVDSERQKEQSTIPSRETILGIWELGNFWKENPEERGGLTQLQYIQKYWNEKCDCQKEKKSINNSTREKIISRATSEKQVVLLSESNGNAEIGWDTRSLEDAKKLLEYGIAFINERLGTKPVECIEFDNEFENQVSHLLASVLNGEYEYNEGFVKHAAQSLLGYAKNEQKPAEVDEYEIIKKHITDDVLSSEVNKRLKECGWYVTDEKPAGATINGEPIPTENHSVDIPLAEWSEEDEEMLRIVSNRLDKFSEWATEQGFPIDDPTMKQSPIAWLKSFPERFNLQPKQDKCPEYCVRSHCLGCSIYEKNKEQWPVEGEFPYNTPADTIEGEIENIWNKLSCENRFTATKEGFREVLLHFVNYVRNNAASGWSEEDEKIRQSIIKDIEFTRNYTEATTGRVIEKYNEQINWLKDLPFNLKKNEDVEKLCPNEWSEEDDDAYKFVTALINSLIWRKDWGISKAKCLKMLKALRPQSRAKTNDYITPHKEFFEWIYNRLIDVHNENPNVDYMQSFRKRIDNLQFDEPQWKPSEEQMKALHAASSVSSLGEYVQRHLFSLYNDLKKLV